jgi:hypothetical protein
MNVNDIIDPLRWTRSDHKRASSRLLLRSAGSLLFFLFAYPAKAMTGNELLEFCNDDAARQLCAVYVNGSVETIQDLFDSGRLARFCMPRQANHKQIVDVLTKSLSEKPQTRASSAPLLIYAAMLSAFPCSGGQ